jgi:3-oxoadipate enol-lactonase
MPRLAINGEQIAYQEQGAGEPVLLVHSLGTSSHIWASTMAALARDFRVIALDCRGHGGSTNHGGFTVDAIADDVRAAADALGISRFHYVGISMGGLFGVAGYAKAPDRFLSLTLADSYASVGVAGPARLATTRELLKTTSMRDFATSYVNDTLMPATARPIHEAAIDAIAGMTIDDYLQTLEAILLADVSGQLPGIRVPTLVIVGERDQRTPVATSEALAAAIEGSELVVVPQAGHLAVLDQPQFFNEALAKFLISASKPR